MEERATVCCSFSHIPHPQQCPVTLTYVDPFTYQIMGNLKIVTTGILFRCATCLFTEMLILLCLTPLHNRIPI
jgi:hypothetical protein